MALSKLVVIVAVLCSCLQGARAAAVAVEPAVSDDVRHAVSWVLDHADHQGRPFAIVDKKAARIHVFEGKGRPIGASAVLLGSTPGDSAVPATAQRPPASLAAHERTTPAGRFASEPGRNDRGEAIVWFDYDAALAIHRLRPAPPDQRREQRLASNVATEHRISLGCVVVPVAFYEAVVAPSLGRQRGVVYVLPETQPLAAMFNSLRPDDGAL